MKSDATQMARDEAMWDQRLAGLSLRAIAEQFSVSHTSVANALDRGYKRRVYPKVDEARKLDVERIDHLLSVLKPRMDAGNDKAAQTYLRALDRRARLLGLDAPIKVEQTVLEVSAQERELEDLLAQAERDAKVKEDQLRAADVQS